MSLTESEPFHFLEFRHGPKATVDRHTLVIGLPSHKKEIKERELAVMQDVVALSGQTLFLDSVLPSDRLPGEALNVLYLPVMQLFAYKIAVAKQRNPYAPRNLEAVVNL